MPSSIRSNWSRPSDIISPARLAPTGSLVYSQLGVMGWFRVSGMLVCLGTFSGIEKVVSVLRQQQEPQTSCRLCSYLNLSE